MKISIESPSPLERKLSVEVPWEMFAEEIDAALRAIQQQATLPGFRKGKAPLEMVRRNYEEEARNEATEAMVRKGLMKAMADGSWKMEDLAGNPYLMDINKPEPGAALAFTAMVELRPVFTPAPLAGVRLEKPVRAVTEAEVDGFVEDLRRQSARPTPLLEDRGLGGEDIATLDFSGTVGGKALPGLMGTDYRVRMGQGRLVEGFENGILGMKPGETRRIDVLFPADYQAKELAGQTAVFDVALKQVHVLRLPEVDDQFATEVSRAKTVAELREMVREDLVKVHADEADRALRGNLARKLLELNPFEVPPSLVDEELKIVGQEYGERMVRMGVPPEQVRERVLEQKEPMLQAARERVRLTFLVLAVAERDALTVEDAEVKAVLEEIARQTGKDPAAVEKEYEEKGGAEEIRFSLLRQKVMDRLLGEAQVDEVPAPVAGEVTA